MAGRVAVWVVAATALWSAPFGGRQAVSITHSDQSAAGVLVAVTDMRVHRAAHSASALADGRVLVAGGFLEKGSAEGAELYEPAAGRFVAASPMVETRHSHSATSLPDGKVLIAGGYGAGTRTLASAELFDPRTNAFTATGPLVSARADHVAIALDNGTVLIVGGLGPGWTFLSSAEIYDPKTGRFEPTGDMSVARESHTAVRLADGRILIAGGHRGRRSDMVLHASAETYDMHARRFSRVGDMRQARHKHDAVRLADGRVLVTGGADRRDDAGVFDTTEWFDPARGTFSPGPSMARPRYKHEGTAIVLPGGRVLLAGGADQAEVYDPQRGSFALVPGSSRMAGLFAAVAPLPSGGALITGGYGSGTGPRVSAWLYRP